MGYRQVMRWVTVVTGIGILGGGHASPAWGQVSFRLVPTAGLTVEYDDNIFFTTRDQQEDVVTRIRASLVGSVDTPRTALSGIVLLTHDLFLRATKESSPTVALGPLTFLYRATPRLTLTLTESFLVTRQASSLSQADVSAVDLGRSDVLRQSAALTARYVLSPLSDLTGTMIHTLTTFPSIPNRDTQNVTASVNLTRALTPRAVLLGSVRYSVRDAATGSDSNTLSPSVGVTYVVSPRMTVTANVGPNFVHFAGAGSRTGMGASATVSYTFPRATLVGSFTQDIGTGAATTANTDVRLLTGRYTRVFAPRLTGFSGFGFTQNETTDGRSLVTTSLSADAGLNYQLTRLLNLSGRYLYRLSTSDAPGPSQTRRGNVVSVTLSGTWQ